MAAEVQAGSRKIDWKLVAETADPAVVRDAIARETRGWGGTFLVLGILHLMPGFADLDPVWGVLLMVTGAISYYFRSAAMLAVYGVLLVWVAVTNMLSGEWFWMGFAALQAYLAFRTFRLFARVRRATVRLGIGLGDCPSDRAAAVFPCAGCALTAAASIGLPVLLIGLGIWSTINAQELNDESIGTAALALVDLGGLGMAMAVAALLARYRFRAVSILAVVGAALMLATVVAIALLGQGS